MVWGFLSGLIIIIIYITRDEGTHCFFGKQRVLLYYSWSLGPKLKNSNSSVIVRTSDKELYYCIVILLTKEKIYKSVVLYVRVEKLCLRIVLPPCHKRGKKVKTKSNITVLGSGMEERPGARGNAGLGTSKV